MEANVTTASENDSESTKPKLFHERIMQHALDHPNQEEYWIHTESMAEGFVLSMAAALKQMYSNSDAPKEDKDQWKRESQRFRHACARQQALSIMRELCEESGERLMYAGMQLRVPDEETCAKLPQGLPFMPKEGAMPWSPPGE